MHWFTKLDLQTLGWEAVYDIDCMVRTLASHCLMGWPLFEFALHSDHIYIFVDTVGQVFTHRQSHMSNR